MTNIMRTIFTPRAEIQQAVLFGQETLDSPGSATAAARIDRMRRKAYQSFKLRRERA
jgi:hypothetical protein